MGQGRGLLDLLISLKLGSSLISVAVVQLATNGPAPSLSGHASSLLYYTFHQSVRSEAGLGLDHRQQWRNRQRLNRYRHL